MVDVVDKGTRSRMMAGIRGRDTKPELFLRKSLHGMGFRYRIGGSGLPGRPDLVFPSRRLAVLVHGCFWHKHDCRYFKWPAQNADFWRRKIEANAKRDGETMLRLEQLYWRAEVVWECELRATGFSLPNPAVTRISGLLRSSARDISGPECAPLGRAQREIRPSKTSNKRRRRVR